MNASVDVQIASNTGALPSPKQFAAWARAVLAGAEGRVELTLRIVDETESAELNQIYRNVPGPTNVLSFPFEAPAGVALPLIGDVVICAPVVRREAGEQGKCANAHFAHMVVHGALHLLGYDHEHESDALRMEAEECRILEKLGFPDPYAAGAAE
ncbi:MAG TPA: rRNA maturation RNase YbeY [Gammaproteobacteria bacterium]